MNLRRAAALVALAAWSCDAPTDGAAGDVDAVTDIGRAAPVAMPDVMRGAMSDASPDALSDTGDGMPADAAPPVDTCEAACARYAACDRLDLVGGADACLDRCDRAGDAAAAWLACLDAEAECGLIRLCRPPTPPPLDCDALCAALADCGGDAFADCRAECATQTADDPAFARCGEALAAGCDLADYWRCLGDTVYRDCGARCRFEAACGAEAPADCLPACIAENTTPDPLRRHRNARRARCVALTGGDCARVENCHAPPPPPVIDRATFCQRWDACLGPIGLDCAYAYAREEGRAGFLACADAVLAEGCLDNPFDVLGRCAGALGPRRPDCAELCEARALCGALPDGLDEPTCFIACDEALGDGDSRAREDRAALLDCGLAPDCPALAACLRARAPATGCADHCAALDRCDVAPPDCAADCVETFHHARAVDHRACVTAAADCAAVRACDRGEPHGCAERCARYAACQDDCPRLDRCDVEPPACLRGCDDEAWIAPELAAARTACVAAAPLCTRGEGAVVDCRFDPGAAGAACLGWCRAGRGDGCGEILDAELADCLAVCVDGLPPAETERFAAARPCLEAAADDCAALAACLDPPPPACAPWCRARAACGLDAPADCAACADDPLSRLRAAEQGACVAAAADCAAVRACDPTEEIIDADALCARHHACGFDPLLPCDMLFDRRPAGFVECLYAEYAACPVEPFDAIERCQIRPAVPALTACEALCAARAACGDLDGSARDCAAACVADVERDPRGGAARALTCGAATHCAAYRACVEPLDPARACPADCAARAACGPVEGDCEARCATGFYRARQVAARRCVAAAPDCAAVTACAAGEPHACDTLCGRYAECDIEPPECERGCDDELFTDDATATRRLACVTAAKPCRATPTSVRACQSDPAATGAACLGWCRLQAGCPATLDAPLADCITRCGEGLTGEDGARFAAAADCLAADVTAVCDDLAACLPPPIDCPAWCAARAACETAPPDCLAACADDPLARLRAATEPACLDGCACPAPVDDIERCHRRCEAHARCGALDGSIRDCAAGCAARLTRDTFGIEAAQLACGRVDTCADWQLCVDAHGPAARCADLCAAALDCGAFETLAACHATCAARLADAWAPPDWIEATTACLRDPATCAAEGPGCLDLRIVPCEAACAGLAGCGFEFPGCVDLCRQEPDPDNWATCVGAAIQPPERCDLGPAIECLSL